MINRNNNLNSFEKRLSVSGLKRDFIYYHIISSNVGEYDVFCDCKQSCFGNLSRKQSVILALTHSDERLHLRAKSSNRMPSACDPTLDQLVDMSEQINMMR